MTDKIYNAMSAQWNMLARHIKEGGRFNADGLTDSAALIELISKRFNYADFGHLSVLDYGCGTGRMFKYLRHIFPYLHGYDISREMISRMSIYESTYGALTATLDIYGEKRFDIIYSCSTLQYIDKSVISQEVERIRELLKVRGIAYLQLPLAEETTEEMYDYKKIRRYNIEDAEKLFSIFKMIKMADTSWDYFILERVS